MWCWCCRGRCCLLFNSEQLKYIYNVMRTIEKWPSAFAREEFTHSVIRQSKNIVINNEIHTLNSVSVRLVSSIDYRMSQWVLRAKLSSARRNLVLFQFLTAFSYLSVESDISGIKHTALLTIFQMQMLGRSQRRIRRNCAPVETAARFMHCVLLRL